MDSYEVSEGKKKKRNHLLAIAQKSPFHGAVTKINKECVRDKLWSVLNMPTILGALFLRFDNMDTHLQEKHKGQLTSLLFHSEQALEYIFMNTRIVESQDVLKQWLEHIPQQHKMSILERGALDMPFALNCEYKNHHLVRVVWDLFPQLVEKRIQTILDVLPQLVEEHEVMKSFLLHKNTLFLNMTTPLKVQTKTLSTLNPYLSDENAAHIARIIPPYAIDEDIQEICARGMKYILKSELKEATPPTQTVVCRKI